MKLPYTFIKEHLRPRCPLMKGHEEQCPPSCTHSPASLFLPQISSKLEQCILYALPLEMNFSMTANVMWPILNKVDLWNSRCLSADSDSLYLLFKPTIWDQSYPCKHQLPYPASRTSFSNTITSCRKTDVVLKLRNVTFAEFFPSSAKILCW